MSKAIYCGSFAPFHLGHCDILFRASAFFNELYVVIAQNANKSNSHTSVEVIQKDLRGYTVDNVRVVELPANKLLVDFAMDLGVETFIRGVRGIKDFTSEFEMADINVNLSHEFCKTVFLASGLNYRHISSSLIRGIPKCERWKEIIEEFMPEHSAKEFIERNSK